MNHSLRTPFLTDVGLRQCNYTKNCCYCNCNQHNRCLKI